MKRLLCAVLFVAACGGDDGEDTPPPREYGGERPVTLQVPDLADGETAPLVMLLHGYSVDGFIQTAYFGLGDIADQRGVFFLAPDGTYDAGGKRYWDASDACCAGADGGTPVDDVAYLGGVLDDVMADWPVDPSRVVVLGHSNGHFMSYRLGCERADVITAIGGLAGAMTSVTGEGCDPSQPVSGLHLHGTDDTVIPYEGGTFASGSFPGAVVSSELWAERVGCDASFAEVERTDLFTDVGDETVIEAASGCDDGVAVERWTIEGGSHIPSFASGGGLRVVDWLLEHPRS